MLGVYNAKDDLGKNPRKTVHVYLEKESEFEVPNSKKKKKKKPNLSQGIQARDGSLIKEPLVYLRVRGLRLQRPKPGREPLSENDFICIYA